MLQFVTGDTYKYSLAEQAQMALEGGCGWIQLHSDLDDATLRDEALPIVEMCREAGAFLTIEDRPELARELGIHGIHLTDPNTSLARLADLRETLGPEAVIGMRLDNPAVVAKLLALDIDYATVHTGTDLQALRDFCATAKADTPEGANPLPIVYAGPLADIANAVALTEAGARGIAASQAILEAQDPVEYTRTFLDTLS